MRKKINLYNKHFAYINDELYEEFITETGITDIIEYIKQKGEQEFGIEILTINDVERLINDIKKMPFYKNSSEWLRIKMHEDLNNRMDKVSITYAYNENIEHILKRNRKACLNELIPVRNIKNPFKFYHIKGFEKVLMTYGELIDAYGEQIVEHCYYYNSEISVQIIYYNPETFVLFSLQPYLLKSISKEELNDIINKMENNIQQYGLDDRRSFLHIYHNFRESLLMEYIRKNKLDSYEEVIKIYMNTEFDFNSFLVQNPQILNNPHERLGESIIKELPDKVAIYRTEINNSTPINNMYLWEVSSNEAMHKVAENDEEDSVIYKAQINKEQIVDYITLYDGTKKIIVLPQDIKLIKIYKQQTLENVLKNKSVNLNNVETFMDYLLHFDFAGLVYNLSKSDKMTFEHMQRISFIAGIIHEIERPHNQILNNDTLLFVMTAGLFHLGGNARFDKYIREFKYKTATEVKELINALDNEDNTINDDSQFNIMLDILKDAKLLDDITYDEEINVDIESLNFDISKEFILLAAQMLNIDIFGN